MTIGWRVLWFVAAVAIWIRVGHRARRAGQRRRFLDVEALRDEGRPEAELLGLPHLVDQIARRLGRAGEQIAAEFIGSG